MRRFISGAVVATIFWYAFGTAQEKRGKIVFPDKD